MIVRDHVRRFTSSSRSLCVLSVGVYPERSRRALDCSFSLVFFNFQPSNLQTFKRFRPNSFPHNLLSDPHPLNPVLSIFCENRGGEGPSSRYFVTSLLHRSLTLNQERFNHVCQVQHLSHQRHRRFPLPAPQPQRQPLPHADRPEPSPRERRAAPDPLRLPRRSSQTECPRRRSRSPRR